MALARHQSETFSMLVVDDPKRRYLAQILSEVPLNGFSLTHVSDLDEAKAHLESTQFDLCLVAHRIAEGVVEPFIDCAGRVESWTPVVVMAEKHYLGQGEKFIHRGAMDFLAWNDIGSDSLEQVLRNNVLRGRQIGSLIRTASVDHLTELFSRRYMETHIDRIIRSQQRIKSNATLFFIDLDHFKAINDKVSYEAGDDMLKDVAEAIDWSVRGVDVVGRWGGDEFVVVLSNTNDESNAIIASRIAAAVQSRSLRNGSAVTASIGIAPLNEGVNTIDDWIGQAASAMKGAKAAGGNGYQVQLESDPFGRQHCANYG